MNSTLESHLSAIAALENSVKVLQLEKEKAARLESEMQVLQSESSKISAQNSDLQIALESQKSATLKSQEEVPKVSRSF